MTTAPPETPPGWYPDPVDDYEARWWDGRLWTENVRTGRYTTTAPVASSPVPEQEHDLWADRRYRITTHAAYLSEGRRPIVVPWWSVAHVSCEVGAAESVSGLGTVLLVIDYPGYTDKRERRLHRVTPAERLCALCWTWTRRNRRGYF